MRPRYPEDEMNNTVLSHESQHEFDRLAAGYHTEFAPKTTHELFLVDQLTQSRWRLDRYRRLEALALEQMIAGELDETNPDAKILQALGGNAFATVTRLASAAEKSYYRAHRELSQGRAREKRNKANDAQTWLAASLRQMEYRDPTMADPAGWDPFLQNEANSPDQPGPNPNFPNMA